MGKEPAGPGAPRPRQGGAAAVSCPQHRGHRVGVVPSATMPVGGQARGGVTSIHPASPQEPGLACGRCGQSEGPRGWPESVSIASSFTSITRRWGLRASVLLSDKPLEFWSCWMNGKAGFPSGKPLGLAPLLRTLGTGAPIVFFGGLLKGLRGLLILPPS